MPEEVQTPSPSKKEIQDLYEKKVKSILFTFNDKIIEIENEIHESLKKEH